MKYISNTTEDRQQMLRSIGVSSFDELIGCVPQPFRQFKWDIPRGISEVELSARLSKAASANQNFNQKVCFLGGGVYDHYVPPVVNRLAERGEFITSYTPYQGEVSQGNLQAIYEYQSMICELTGMDYSNASMYDGASAAAEAVLLALRHTTRKKVLIAGTVHPEYIEVIKTYTSCLDVELVFVEASEGSTNIESWKKHLSDQIAALVFASPNFFGFLEHSKSLCQLASESGALSIMISHPLSLGYFISPGECGADVGVGEGQPLGNSVAFGGPHFGYFTVREHLLRKIPGRICGMTTDKIGRRAFTLTLQAREQHIRRQNATSNICTNHALCALKATIYMGLLGQKGLRKIALLNHSKAKYLQQKLIKLKGVKLLSGRPFFNEFSFFAPRDEKKLLQRFHDRRLMAPLKLSRFWKNYEDCYLVAVTEKRTLEEMDRFVEAFDF